MNSKDRAKPFSDIPSKVIFPAGIIAIAVYELFHYFGHPDTGRIAAFFVIALVGVIAKCRPLWNEAWFWAAVSIVTLLHLTVIVSVQWPDPHYPALILAPFAFIDYFVIMKLIEVAYHWFDQAA